MPCHNLFRAFETSSEQKFIIISKRQQQHQQPALRTMTDDDTASKPLVTITGVTGYLGSQVCLSFLQDGSYRVRGTVRSLNSDKVNQLQDGLGDHNFSKLELVEADLMNEESLIKACQDSTYIIHTASPFHFKGDCVTPAVQGTTAIMKACTIHKNTIKRVVITSSCAAALAPAKEDQPPDGVPYDETYWSNPNRPEGLHDYMKSKTLAEKTAWDYQQKEVDSSFELVTILPTFIVGPAPMMGDGGTSINWMKGILFNTNPNEIVPSTSRGFVDVRDVAVAHVKAIQIEKAANQRFILYNERVPQPTLYNWLSTEFNDKPEEYAINGGKQPIMVPTKLNPNGRSGGGDLVDNTKSKTILQIQYTPLQQTMIDFGKQLISSGRQLKA